MKLSPQNTFLFILTFLLLSNDIFAKDLVAWRPITPADLEMDKPKVDPDADAEAIFWEVRLDDKNRKKLSYEHYVRVKIFTERGRERFSKFDIPFFKGKKVEDVAARVIKPDGSVVNLQPSDIFEREIVKQRKLKIQAKSFAVPGIAPGVIVEYQYREVFKNDSADGERLYFQRDIPLQKVTYYVRPYRKLRIRFKPNNMTLNTVKQNDEGFYVATAENVPAYKEEPRMPPDEEIRRWVYLSYNYYGFSGSWVLFAGDYGRGFTYFTEPNKQIEGQAANLTANAKSDMDKLKRLYEFTQNHIVNLSFKKSTDSKKLKVKKAADVLKKGRGYAPHIDYLFASLARAEGFDVHLAMLGDRSENFFDPRNYPINGSYIKPGGIAVKVDGRWHFFNPGTPYLPFGKLLWYEEGVYALLTSEGWSRWTRTRITPHDKTRVVRKAKFELTEEGALVGDVTYDYTGNWAITHRRGGFLKTVEERATEFEEDLKEWMGTGEFSNIRTGNFEAKDKPVTFGYSVRIPDYATKTGKRMFFQPGVFKFGSKPEFSSATRQHPIYFNYPWSEIEEIEIKLPDGFKLENFTVPGDIKEKSDLGNSKYKVTYDIDSHTLSYKRNFYFGGKERIVFPAKVYTPLKKLFDLFHKSDSHTLSLKRD